MINGTDLERSPQEEEVVKGLLVVIFMLPVIYTKLEAQIQTETYGKIERSPEK